MDQLLQALQVLKKYHFWILVVIILIVGAGLWTKASAELSAQFTKRKGELNKTRTDVLQISTNPTPANDKVVAAIKQKKEQLQGNVLEAWRFLYAVQKKNNPWPAELQQGFLDTIKALGEDEEIPSNHRMDYGRFINRHLPALDGIIDRRRPKETNANAAVAPGALAMSLGGAARQAPVAALGQAQEWEGKVDWVDADQVKKQFELPSLPSSMRIRLAQEDLWVYEALLHIIKNTNEGATSHNNAAIKVIEHLEIGRAAAAAFQAKSGVAATAVMAPAGGENEGNNRRDRGLNLQLGTAATVAQDVPQAEREKAELYQNRYVDQTGAPLAADAAPPFAEFKMMPVHMVLVIDQKKIPKLLVECGNSSMPVEVQRVTITSLTKPPQSGFSGAGLPGGMAGADTSRRDRGLNFGAMPGLGAMPGQIATGESDGSDNYARVDVLGIIYIFNPPNEKTLGTGTAGEMAAVPGLGMPLAPAAKAPSPTTPAAGGKAPAPGAPSAPATAPAGGKAPAPSTPGAPGRPPAGAAPGGVPSLR